MDKIKVPHFLLAHPLMSLLQQSRGQTLDAYWTYELNHA